MRRIVYSTCFIAHIAHRYLCLYVLCLFMSFAIAAAEPVVIDNHFRTTENHSRPPEQPQQIDPLVAYPVAQYAVHGVVIMEDNAVALIHTPRNTWHRLRVHLHLGQEQAVIREITIRGIRIEIDGTLLWLPVLQ